nr:reverse transcriptase domain-containing protein [Tanacetum cinerariifolium]
MHTGSKSYPNNSNATIPRCQNRRRVPNIVEPEIRTIEEVVPMVDRTTEELLQAPMEGYGEAIIILKILEENFKIKTNLLQLVQTNKFHDFERDNPHTHISNFKMMTLTFKYKDVPNDAIKLMLFSYSLEGAARIWESSSKTDDRIDKLADQISNLVEIVNKQVITPATAKEVEKTCVICEGAHAYYDCIATDINKSSVCVATDKEQSNCQGSTVHIQPPVVPTHIPEPDVSKTQPKPNIPYPSRVNDQKLRAKATNQMEKFFQIFHDLHFDISFADALLLMPKFASTIKSLLTNKDKLFELAKVTLNENCPAMLLKKLPENLGDLGKFLIPCDFPRIDVCHALADLDRSITRPKGVVEDVFVKVGKFYFPIDFVVVDFEAGPRRQRVNFVKSQLSNLLHTTLTPFGESDFFLEDIKDFLKDKSIPTGIEDSCYDPEGDILYLEKLLNDDPSQLPPMNLKQAEETKAKSAIEELPEL